MHGPTAPTKPPAFSMRSVSAGSSGLWSSESATASPARHKIARESPMLATTTRKGRATSGGPSHSSNATTAVLPVSAKAFLTSLGIGPPQDDIGRNPSWPSPAARIAASSEGNAALSARPARPPSTPLAAGKLFQASAAMSAATATTSAGRSWAARLETAEPPWPSKTANMAWEENGASRPRMAQQASSIAGRQPLISEVAQ
mmetsp:Transcript_110316/g.276174  ORF Transcript_110316/g.276174 Transcript_110316/m.276174 type:complete len:202 (+) Transcript_110316:362-967(+)